MTRVKPLTAELKVTQGATRSSWLPTLNDDDAKAVDTHLPGTCFENCAVDNGNYFAGMQLQVVWTSQALHIVDHADLACREPSTLIGRLEWGPLPGFLQASRVVSSSCVQNLHISVQQPIEATELFVFLTGTMVRQVLCATFCGLLLSGSPNCCMALQDKQEALPFLTEPHDALRLGVRSLKEDASVSHPVEAIQANVRRLCCISYNNKK